MQHTFRFATLLGIFLAGLPVRAATLPPPVTKEGLDLFEQKIRPMLVRHCYECHSGDPAKAKGKFALDTRDSIRRGGQSGPVIVPGQPGDSLLIEAIRHEGLEMPPSPKPKLSDEVIADFVRWVELGAPDPRHGKAAKVQGKIDFVEARKFWSFQRPKAAPVPAPRDTSWPKTDIDRFIRARQEKENLAPVRDADRTTLIRRVTFDLTGLPPTPEDIDAFVKDPSPNAYQLVVDRLLASPQFGERWGRHWLDIVRYAESTGKERNYPFRYAWRYRDYVIDAFNADKPFDRFSIEQLAGDLLPSPKNPADQNAQLIATGFLAVGPKGVNTRNTEQFDMDVIDDQIDVTSRAFLGITVACARCHDHKFDPIPTADYYGLAGIFKSTETYSGVGQGKRNAGDNLLISLPSAAGQLISPQEATADQARRDEMAEIEARLYTLRTKMKKKAQQKKQAAKLAQETGTEEEVANQKKKNKRNKNRAMAKVEESDPGRERIKKLQDRLAELEKLPTSPVELAMGVKEAAVPVNARILDRGELKSKGAEVPRGVLSVLRSALTPQIKANQSGRLQLAQWIASRDNPLTARVFVNRVWQHLFGEGLVDTVDNFGALGNDPSHPELLDTLAVQFMKDKWSVKTLIRSIVLSRTYQLSSEHHDGNYKVDAPNRYLWRMSRRRLDAEEIRDAMLVASGRIDLKRPTGSPVTQMDNGQVRRTVGNTVDSSTASGVRSVYLPIVRGQVPEMLAVFDMADPSLVVGKRDVTMVATQALFLMNNQFVIEQADAMAKRVQNEPGLSESARIVRAYQLALGRKPTDRERAAVEQYLQNPSGAATGTANSIAWSRVCQVLFASGEFRFVY